MTLFVMYEKLSVLNFTIFIILIMKVHRITRNLLILPRSMIVRGHEFFQRKVGRKASHRASLQKNENEV